MDKCVIYGTIQMRMKNFAIEYNTFFFFFFN